MTTTDTYNGWTNRATWLVNLHLSNDHATYLDVRDQLASILPRAILAGRARWTEQTAPGTVEAARNDLVRSSVRWELGQHLKGYVESMVVVYDATDDPRTLLANDLVGTVLASVDWHEIVDGWWSDIDEDDDAYDVECSGCTTVVDARWCTVDPDADPFCNECALEALAARDASLGVGHVWTRVECNAYRTLDPADCTCGRD